MSDVRTKVVRPGLSQVLYRHFGEWVFELELKRKAHGSPPRHLPCSLLDRSFLACVACFPHVYGPPLELTLLAAVGRHVVNELLANLLYPPMDSVSHRTESVYAGFVPHVRKLDKLDSSSP